MRQGRPVSKVPFEDDLGLNFHFDKHKAEFLFTSADEYQAAADEFMSIPVKPPMRECTRTNGDRVRFNRGDGCFAVQAPSGWIKTFHKPAEKYIFLAFFKWECGRVDVT
jgi:pyocin large subunit-like protein